MCDHCIDCSFRCEPFDGEPEMCYLDPENPVEIHYDDRACRSFELSEEAEAERRKAPGEL